MQRRTAGLWRRFGLSGRLAYAVIAGYALAAAVIVSSCTPRWHLPGVCPTAGEVASALCILFTTACAAWTARSTSGRHRFGWLALATGMFASAVGQAAWSVYGLHPQLEHGTHSMATDTVLLAVPVGIIVSLSLLSDGSLGRRWQLALDSVIVAGSLFLPAWIFVLDPLVSGNDSSRMKTSAHMFTDIVVITTAILFGSRGRPGDPASRNLLACGVVISMVGDSMRMLPFAASPLGGDLMSVVLVIGLCLLALAALGGVHESGKSATPARATSRVRLFLPYLPMLIIALAVLVRAVHQGGIRPVPMTLAFLVAAVLARQLLVLVENQALLAKVADEAFRDGLTGLPNRAHFLRQLERAIAGRSAGDPPIAVLTLDLDDFKSINDSRGHPTGDQVLVRAAGRITAAVAEVGTAARLSGDEFAVLIEGPADESRAAAHRLLQSFQAPIIIDGIPLAVRPSIGFATTSADSNGTVDELLSHSDAAMYAAKHAGGQCIRDYDPDQNHPTVDPDYGDGPAANRIAASPTRTRPPPQASHSPHGQDDRMPYGVRWPPTGIRLAMVAVVIGVLARAIPGVVDKAGGPTSLLALLAYPLLTLAVATLVAVRACRVPAERVAWLLIAAGMSCTALAAVVYHLWVPAGQSPSMADPIRVASYPLAYAGLLLLTWASLQRLPLAVKFDALICGLTAAAIIAALLIAPNHRPTDDEPVDVWAPQIYSWCTLVVIAFTAALLPILGWRNDIRRGLLVTGFLFFSAADSAYLLQNFTHAFRAGFLLDACWIIASLLVAVSSWMPVTSRPRRLSGGFDFYAAPVICTVVSLVITAFSDSWPAKILALLSMIAVTARFSVTFHDVSLLAQRHRHAMTDELTLLPNRRSLATALTALSAKGVGTGSAATQERPRRALLVLELEEFQQINESVGHRLGDDLLRRSANRLAATMHGGDLLARVDDDEFAVLLAEGSDLSAAQARASDLLEVLSTPFALDPITVQLDSRIGLALWPDHCDHPQELLTRAETAITHANSPQHKIVVYDPAFDLYHDNDPGIVEELRAALADGDALTCHYQPKVNAHDGSLHSVEALLRWQHPSRGLLLPEQFLPAIERAGLMRMVSSRTVDLALGQIRAWRTQGLANTVAVNLSTTNLLDLDLVSTIERLLHVHELPAEALIIEITESTLIDSPRSRTTVAELRRLGVRISLDDYGTGWSSLARLQDLSVDELKLDRIFVARLDHDRRSVAIVRSTVALASSLGADLVVEGVESQETLAALRRYGCTITQGFVHSPPLPAEEMGQWIADHRPQHDAEPARPATVTD